MVRRRPVLVAVAVVSLTLVAACSGSGGSTGDTDPATTTGDSTESSTGTSPRTTDAEAAQTTAPASAATGVDRAYYILPPGNYGGVPTNDDSLDQLDLYSGLTPLRDNVTDADLDKYFLPQDFAPVGETTVEETGRDGVEIVYDEFGVPHITGETREDVAFGAGWVTARDRGLLFTLGRGPARAAIADVPGIDAFGLVTSATPFVPSAAAEQLVTDQVELLREVYGEEGDEIIADAQAYADGINAYWEANNIDETPATVNDVVAATAFIGSIFGAGGGGEVYKSLRLAELRTEFGDEQAQVLFDELTPTEVPDTPTTLDKRFKYPVLSGGGTGGAVVLDDGSLVDVSPIAAADGPTTDDSTTDDPATDDSATDATTDTAQDAALTADPVAGSAVYVRPSDHPPYRLASNWLLVSPERSANGTTLAVMGPQLGYYYPEIVQQMHLKGPDFEAQGAAAPGLAMYMLIGRTADYAWSLTSASHDVVDTFAEKLCEPDGSAPTADSRHYEFNDECIPFETFEAGTINSDVIAYPVSVHGPLVATATVDGAPVALTRQRSTFGRDALNLGALKHMTEGKASTADKFFTTANQFGFTFNWGYANNNEIGYFSSGYLPVRAKGVDRRLPTWGTGEYEWTGFLKQDEHPHSSGDEMLVNWNNQSAPGFIHNDSPAVGSVQRVELFDQWPDKVQLTDVVGVMNRAASEDVRAPIWPVVSEVLRSGEAPSPLSAQVVEMLDAYVADDAPLVDANDDGVYDNPGGGVLDLVISTIGTEAMTTGGVDIGSGELDRGSVIDTDLRALLGDGDGFAIPFCGDGDKAACATALWAAVDTAATQIASEQGDDPTAWKFEASRTGFAPGLIPDDFPTTNRPTYQQVIEFTAP